jgi:hypothetical protein
MFMLNAFSLNMFTVFPSEVRFMEMTVEQLKILLLVLGQH